jgi:hypothetical protein
MDTNIDERRCDDILIVREPMMLGQDELRVNCVMPRYHEGAHIYLSRPEDSDRTFTITWR